MPSYTRLTLAEREEISRELAAGSRLRAIARQLGRAPSTIGRELRRAERTRSTYRATRGQHVARRAAQRRPPTAPPIEPAPKPSVKPPPEPLVGDPQIVEELIGSRVRILSYTGPTGTFTFSPQLEEGRATLSLDLQDLRLGFNEPWVLPLPGLAKQLERGAGPRELLDLDPSVPGNEPLKEMIAWASGLQGILEKERIERIFGGVDLVFGLMTNEALSYLTDEDLKVLGEAVGKAYERTQLHETESWRIVERTEELATRYFGQKVALGIFLKEGCGVCRHRALLFRDLGKAAGLIVLPRRGEVDARRHTWNEVVTSQGERFLIDLSYSPRIVPLFEDPLRELYWESVPAVERELSTKDVVAILGSLPDREGFGLTLWPAVTRVLGFTGSLAGTVRIDTTRLDAAKVQAILGKTFRVKEGKLVDPSGLEEAALSRVADFFRAMAVEAPRGLTPVVIGAGLEERYPELKVFASVKTAPVLLSRGDPVEDVATLIAWDARQIVFAGLEEQAGRLIPIADRAGITVTRVVTPGSQEFTPFFLTVVSEAAGLEEAAVAAREDFGRFLDDVAALRGQV